MFNYWFELTINCKRLPRVFWQNSIEKSFNFSNLWFTCLLNGDKHTSLFSNLWQNENKGTYLFTNDKISPWVITSFLNYSCCYSGIWFFLLRESYNSSICISSGAGKMIYWWNCIFSTKGATLPLDNRRIVHGSCARETFTKRKMQPTHRNQSKRRIAEWS